MSEILSLFLAPAVALLLLLFYINLRLASPLLAIPIAYWLEGDRPPRRAIVGGVLAVAGCIALTAAR